MALGFTAHARLRMGERKISRERVLAVLSSGWLEERAQVGRALYRGRVNGLLTWVRVQVRGELVLVVTVWDELSNSGT
jgi:hypothetical protein